MQIIDIEAPPSQSEGTRKSRRRSESTEKLLSSIKDIALKRAMPVEAIHNGAMGIGTFIVDTIDSQQLDALIDEVQRHWRFDNLAPAGRRRLGCSSTTVNSGRPRTRRFQNGAWIFSKRVDYRPIALADAVGELPALATAPQTDARCITDVSNPGRSFSRH